MDLELVTQFQVGHYLLAMFPRTINLHHLYYPLTSEEISRDESVHLTTVIINAVFADILLRVEDLVIMKKGNTLLFDSWVTQVDFGKNSSHRVVGRRSINSYLFAIRDVDSNAPSSSPQSKD